MKTQFRKYSSLDSSVKNISNKKKEKLPVNPEASLRTIFDNTSVAYVQVDKEFNIITYNQTAAAGYKRELKSDLVQGKNLIDYLPKERKELARKRHEKVLHGEKINYEINYGNTEENHTFYNVSMFPVYDNLNNMLGLIISSEDITARKKAESEKEKVMADLVERNRDLEQFAHIISHNLRSQVANILGISNLVVSNNSCINNKDHKILMAGLAVSAEKLDFVTKGLNNILEDRRVINMKTAC